MSEICLEDCTRNPETCPVTEYPRERQDFELSMSLLDTSADVNVQVIGAFVSACARGDCPGQDPELAKQILREKRAADRADNS